MTPEELQALMGRIGNPDTQAEAIVEMNEKVSAMIAQATETADAIREKDNKILELQGTALKLAMAQTGNPQPDPEPELTPEQEAEKFNAELREEYFKGYAY